MRLLLLASLAYVSLAACSLDNGGDGGRTDAGGDHAVVSGDPCATTAVVDLSATAPDSMGVVHWTDNDSTAQMLGGPQPPATCAGGVTAAQYEVVFRYTLTQAASLQVSTANPGTDAAFDSLVYVLDACASSANVLGCDHDSLGTGQSTAVTSVLPMGTMVFILVAGNAPPASGRNSAGGFELTVTELGPGSGGTACDGSSVCPMDTSCVPTRVDPSAMQCLPDGAQGDACRAASPRCDGALQCSSMDVTLAGFCRVAVASGGVCDVAAQQFGCAAGTTCAPTPAMPTMGTCRPDGAQGTPCRDADPRCDTGLTCSGATALDDGFCQMLVAAGAACDPSGMSTGCMAGATCLAVLATPSSFTCQADGAHGAACRDADPRCDTGLACSSSDPASPGFCRATAASNGACGPDTRGDACPAPQVCTLRNGATAACGRVVTETEPNNTPAMAQAGLGALPVAVAGAIGTMADVDCFAFAVGAGQSVFAQTNDGAGGCPSPGDTTLALYRSDGTMVALDDDSGPDGACSQIDGSLAGPAHALAAGTYALCVASHGDVADPPVVIPAYDLDIALLGP